MKELFNSIRYAVNWGMWLELPSEDAEYLLNYINKLEEKVVEQSKLILSINKLLTEYKKEKRGS